MEEEIGMRGVQAEGEDVSTISMQVSACRTTSGNQKLRQPNLETGKTMDIISSCTNS